MAANIKTPSGTKLSKPSSAKKVYNDRISDEVGNYEKHQYFVKKANDAKEFLDRVGLPKEFLEKRK
jgi:hypothetical protein